MNTRELAALIGREISVLDQRTGTKHTVEITDTVCRYGKVRIEVNATGVYFEPSSTELQSAQNSGEVEG